MAFELRSELVYLGFVLNVLVGFGEVVVDRLANDALVVQVLKLSL